MTSSFDLTPDPRVLQILGEINLEQWKCLAELIDNGIDAFINARRSGGLVDTPEIAISLPTSDREDSAISVRDNGPGMTIDQLESAVRAGWSGNNPLDNLGLFGMGFNIATARLGMVTEVYTTRPGETEWTGLRIDLQELRRTRSYHTPRLTRPKAEPAVHGTEIRILKLKPDQRVYFSKSANHQRIRRHLSRIYAPFLVANETSFNLQTNGQLIQPKRHCHWDPQRSVQGADGRSVHAVESFDFALPSRLYCKTCMLSFMERSTCPTNSPQCDVIELKRRLHGWVGLQRYLHEEDFGIDLIRNGRVIEAQSKELFVWNGGERPEREYPIDDQRYRGRFIGEIHLDHCRVSYTKDRFERDDPAWVEMVALVRGEGPLQPQKARSLGFGPQDAPLNRLFQAFRRSSPQGKSGRWSRILVVKNNERAIEMADSFNKGEADYQTDERWFELVEEEDRALVGASLSSTNPTPTPVEIPEGLVDEASDVDGSESQTLNLTPPAPVQTPKPVFTRERLHELSRIYKHPLLKVEFNIEAFFVDKNDPDLPRNAPWVVKLEDPGTRTYLYLFNPSHNIFRSITMTPIDALLNELAFRTYDFLKDASLGTAHFASILADFRQEYATAESLNSKEIIANSDSVLREIALAPTKTTTLEENRELFQKLPELEQDTIRRKVSASGASGLQSVIDDGDFLAYLSPNGIRQFFKSNAQLFFDGQYWDQPYVHLDYGNANVNVEAQGRVIERYDGYLKDVEWLATQTPRDLDRADRDEIIRATLSIKLLRSDISN